MASSRRKLLRSHPDDLNLADLRQPFALLSRRLARQGRRVRLLAVEADEIAKGRGIARHSRDKRQLAAREEIRDHVGYHAAWARWSATSDEMAALAGRIFGLPAWTLGDLALKFEVLAWLLLEDSTVVDTEAVRHVRRFRRELRRLVAKRG